MVHDGLLHALLLVDFGESLAFGPDAGGGRRDRTRFLAALATLLSALFTLIILAQWLAAVIHGPCQPGPRLPSSPDAVIHSASSRDHA